MTSNTRLLQSSPVRNEVYTLIRDNPKITTSELCEKLPDRDENEVRSAVMRLNGFLTCSRGRDSQGRRTWEVIR